VTLIQTIMPMEILGL